MEKIFVFGLFFCFALFAASPAPAAEDASAPRNPHPYRDINWSQVKRIRTTSHMHLTNEGALKRALSRKFEFLTVSNYYPSVPWYPLAEVRRNMDIVDNSHPVFRVDNPEESSNWAKLLVKPDMRAVPGPFDWNEIVSPWLDQLPEQERAKFPIKIGDKVFSPLPANVMEAPNAEHFMLSDMPKLHCNSLGSFFRSGTFDRGDRAETLKRGGYLPGCGFPWRSAFAQMLASLQYPDGGGVTLNHPRWSGLTVKELQLMLDFDPRVLGLEVYNQTCEKLNGKGWSTELWDQILAGGTQCFGFFVSDHASNFGVNVLLVPEGEADARACLRAYRQGNWYGALIGTGPGFTKIEWDGKRLTAVCDAEVDLRVVAATGVVAKKTGHEIVFEPGDAEKLVYLRVEADAKGGERLFSQAVMLGVPKRQ